MSNVLRRCGFPLFLSMAAASSAVLPCDAARGELTLSFASTAPDLSTLPVGQTVTFTVDLSGLLPGEELDALAATVVYDAALLGPPTIAPGPIVPDPLDDPFDFMVFTAGGVADASFLTFGLDPSARIAANGTFFSFSVEVLAEGGGTLSFDFVDASQFNPADPGWPILRDVVAGPDLGFTAVVPEPGVWLLLASAAGLLLVGGRVRYSRNQDR